MRLDRTIRAMLHPIMESRVQSAKRRHRKTHPECLVCGSDSTVSTGNRCDVHHVLPVHVAEKLACDPLNLRTLCRSCHFVVGHCSNWKDYNGNVDKTIQAVRIAYQATAAKVKA